MPSASDKLSDGMGFIERKYQEENSLAGLIVEKMLRDGIQFRLVAGAEGGADTLWYYNTSEHQRVWKMYPSNPTQQRQVLGQMGVIDTIVPSNLLSELEARAFEYASRFGSINDQFNKPQAAVFYKNVVFDWEAGHARPYEANDFRRSRGTTEFDVKATADDCEETLGLVKWMSAGDTNLERLIHCVNALNIVGLHTIDQKFKCAFFIWSAPVGFSGRTTLFNIVDQASGGALVPANDLEDVTDPLFRFNLIGRNGVFCDERQTSLNAKSPTVATIKQLVGGISRQRVTAKYRMPEEHFGHWTVNQTLNSMDFLYSADKALVERCVAICTQVLPDEVKDAFDRDPKRGARQRSIANSSGYVLWLRQNLGTLDEICLEIKRLRTEYLPKLKVLADTSEPFQEFCEEFIVPDPEQEIRVASIQDAFHDWLTRRQPGVDKLGKKMVGSRLSALYPNQVDKGVQRGNHKSPCLRGHALNREALDQDLDRFNSFL